MGKILLVEPSRILRQAIRLSLFPENEVRVEERITDSKAESLEEYDLVILDGPELREHGWWSPELDQTIERSGAAVLWLEDEDGVQTSKQEKQLILKKPIVREALQTAVASFFSPSGPEKKQSRRSAPPEDKPRATEKTEAEEPPAVSSLQETFEFIDLVDAVEEDSASQQPRKSARKSK